MNTYIVFHLNWERAQKAGDFRDGRPLVYEICHRADQDAIKEALVQHLYDAVAVVEAETLEDVFRLTNHIEDSWLKNDAVCDLVPSARSTSVGDIVITCHGSGIPERHVVAGFGFDEMPIIGGVDEAEYRGADYGED